MGGIDLIYSREGILVNKRGTFGLVCSSSCIRAITSKRALSE